MKKFLLGVLVVLVSFNSFSQDVKIKNNVFEVL